MPVQIRCQCGKRYRVADAAGSKRLRCKDCGAELVMPRQKPETASGGSDDELDEFDIDSHHSVADHFSPRPRLPPRAGRSRSQSEDDDSSAGGVFAVGDVIVRGSALFVFLVALGNCAFQLLWAEVAPGQDRMMGVVIWGIAPLLVAGPFSLYIAWIGEEPDPEACRANRIAGLVKCGIGFALFAIGGILTIVVSVFLAKRAGMGVAFTGLMFGGVMMIVYGGLSVLTGREFTKTGFSSSTKGSGRKARGSGSDPHDIFDNQEEESDRQRTGQQEPGDDAYAVATDRQVRPADGSRRRAKRRTVSGEYANLIGIMIVAGVICIVAALAAAFWPAANQDEKPQVADANQGNGAVPRRPVPKFVPPAMPPAPVLPPKFDSPVPNQPAPEVAGGPATNDPPGPPGRGPGRRGGFPRGGPVGPGRFRGGMPPTAPGFGGAPGAAGPQGGPQASPPGAPRSAGPPSAPRFPPFGGQPPTPPTMSPRIGGNTAAHSYTETSDKPMLGLRFELGDWEGLPTISYLKPVFDRGAAADRGQEIMARPGYVVGGLEVDADKLVNALRIIFVRIGDDQKIVAGDTYTSEWIGKPTGRAVRTIDAGGKLVVGYQIGQPGKDAPAIVSIGLALK